MATKRKEKEPEQSHSSRFLSRKHEKHFKVVQDRRLLMERKVGMIPNFAPQFGEQLLGNDWGKLATYPAPANIVVVKEFYTNAKKIDDYPVENYLGYVRGHAIRYDPDSINNFLDTVWAGEQCQFALCMEEGADFEDVERVLCILGGHFQRNRSGSVVNIRRIDLTPLAKYWMALSHACEFGERSEEGERWNQKRHQKVQKEKPQLPLSGSFPLSGTQEHRGDPLRGKMAVEGKNRARALTAERHTYGLGPKFSVILE
ncbi:hypothetical protein LR48_Vigan09g055600 [Vigna angularis]|uniref:Putative plant transposon protein domain-containing protein n=1 Tax=Phaseolus angularis TaxID=3914 RepID=A0A0L9VAE2_PHAAN|nr:hypothetical protein LR48_Vigan09g055600 [Vigna angularis]